MSTLLMPFLNESHDYTLGFEAGQIWEIICEGNIVENKPFHTSQRDQIILMCETIGCNYEINKLDDVWSSLVVKSII